MYHLFIQYSIMCSVGHPLSDPLNFFIVHKLRLNLPSSRSYIPEHILTDTNAFTRSRVHIEPEPSVRLYQGAATGEKCIH